MPKCDCLIDPEKRIYYAAEVAVVMLYDERFKKVPFDILASDRDRGVLELSKEDLAAFEKFSVIFHKAVFTAHLQLFGKECDIDDDDLFDSFYELVLNSYCRMKEQKK